MVGPEYHQGGPDGQGRCGKSFREEKGWRAARSQTMRSLEDLYSRAVYFGWKALVNDLLEYVRAYSHILAWTIPAIPFESLPCNSKAM